VVQVELELAAAIARGDPALGIVEERPGLGRRQPDEPLEADGAGVWLLHAEGGRDLGPHARELFQHLLAGRPRDATVGEVAPQVWLEKVPAPRRDHWRMECITRPGGTSARKLVACASAKPTRVSGCGTRPSTAAIAYPCLSRMAQRSRRTWASRQASKSSVGWAV